jgi:uncharacterized repeat protein (TIGR01451 family)
MSTVYFTNLRTTPNRSLLDKIEDLLNRTKVNTIIKKNDLVAIKLHFGEHGNTAYLRPLFLRTIVNKIKKLDCKPFLTDTNTLYSGSRSDSVSHFNTAIEHGFGYSSVGCPLIIAGGLKGKVVYGPTVRIELTNPSSIRVRVPVTGVNVGGAEYGGQMISTLLLEPGGATSFPAPPAWIPQQNDLSITTTASAPRMEAGGVLIYTLVMANAGPSTATGATFADTLPGGLGTITSVNTVASAGSAVTFSNANTSLFGTLTIPPGGSVKVTFQVSVLRDFVGPLTNEATVSPAAGAVDPSMANNISSASVLVTPPTTCTRSSFWRKGTCPTYPVAGGEVP